MSRSAEDSESETEPAESVAKGLSGEVSTYNTVFGTYLAFILLDSYNGPPEEALPRPNSSRITIPKGQERITVIKDSSSTRLGVTTEAIECEREKACGGGKSVFCYLAVTNSNPCANNRSPCGTR